MSAEDQLNKAKKGTVLKKMKIDTYAVFSEFVNVLKELSFNVDI